jgi:hypothetical protein
MIFIHENVQLYIVYKDQALKSKEKLFAVQCITSYTLNLNFRRIF